MYVRGTLTRFNKNHRGNPMNWLRPPGTPKVDWAPAIGISHTVTQ
jgi:hypothetical protein